MSLLDKASLIVTPNAYKESKLYSVVPNTTLGDMDVVRATTATRVNSAGLIEEVPRNLLTYSNTFSNVAWTKDRVTVASSEIISPDGTANATKLMDTLVGNNAYRLYNSLTLSAQSYTQTFYAKSAEYNWVYVRIGNSLRAWFNLSNGTLGTIESGLTASISPVNDGWYKITCTITTATAGSGFALIGLTPANGIDTYTTTTSTKGIYIYGAQLDQGTTATEYFPTTTRLNIPRIDYTNGSCPSLLVEPQRTNLFLQSNTFSNAAWSKNSCTISANSIVSPNGIQNASKLVEGTANDSHHIYQNVISSGQNTFTFYAKQGERKFVYAYAESAGQGKCFDLENGTLGVNIIAAPLNSSITSVGNGWYRCSITISITATALRIGACSANGTFSYLGNGTSGIYLYGAQIEAGSYPTSYIPTVASSVTRNADIISKTGISSLINSQEGVLFADLQFFTGIGNIRSIHISNGDNNNRIGFYGHPSIANRITFAISSGGVITDINFNGVTLTNRNKVLIRYSGTTFTAFVNGVKSTNQTFTPFAANFLNRIGLDYGEDILRYEGRINSIQLYKTALTDAECIALTTL